jgi:UDP:flavonoid glycosyltransferase YjiC (YdhE family)
VSRILFTWELGGGYGHIAHILPLAEALRARGHDCTLALRDLSRAGALVDPARFRLVQAPVWLPTAVGMPPPESYAEILLHFGFLQARLVRGLVQAWRSLYALVQPDFVVFNHSPTAMLAASGLALPVATVETGFSGPPRSAPLPPLRWWQAENTARLLDSEQRVLKTVNTLRVELGAPPCLRLADLLAADEQFLCSFRELDHYPVREAAARYWGPVFSLDAGAEPRWPAAGGPRVFAYVNASFRDLETLMKALAGLRGAALLHAPGIASALAARYRNEHLQITAEPLNMRAVRADCDVAICHGPGTAAAVLLAGKPLLLLPSQLEQYMFARRIAELGAGLVIGGESRAADYPGTLRRLLTEPGFRMAAEQFASAHADFDQTRQVGGMADRCEELLASTSPPR